MKKVLKNTKQPFKPRAKLLLELGNQLIKDEGIALFELVKNAYDADATEVNIIMEKIDLPDQGKIIISDDGSGMDWDTITSAWLEPGTNYRQEQIKIKKRSINFKRLPLGQKGIGRFGAHKLGKDIELVTRSKGEKEIVVNIDWRKFETEEYLEDVPVEIKEREPKIFTGKKTGTILTIKSLWMPWDKVMARNVYRAINSICSPIKSPTSFSATFDLKDGDKIDWFKNLISWKEALSHKLYNAVCIIDNGSLSYEYNFLPWGQLKNKVASRKVKQTISLNTNLSKYAIGKVKITLDIFDLGSETLTEIKDKQGLKDFLKFNGGIRVYRDGVRVYDYGEAGNDWLQLGVRRVNDPSEKLSNNLVLGEVSIDRLTSNDLIEKTNREGFVENEAVIKLRDAIIEVIVQIEAERNKDKDRLRKAFTKAKHKEPVLGDLAELRIKIEKKGLTKDFGGYLDRVEKDYKDIKDRLLTTAGVGLSFAIVIHEIEKIIGELKLAVDDRKDTDRVKKLASRLSELVEGYSMLVKKDGNTKLKSSELITQTLFNLEYRLNIHKIKVLPSLKKKFDFTVPCSRKLILGALMNLIDNSIWWVENKKPLTKYITIFATDELGSPAIIIGDNGPGFIDELDDLIRPFFTRKPEGMGLGLHIADEIMRAHGGKLRIIDSSEITLPKEITGAVIALVFNKNESNKK